MENHPIAECYPNLSAAEYEQLKAHIGANGLQNPIVLYDGKILDGTQRARACEELGIEPIYVAPEIKDPYQYVIGANERRRHLSAAQRAVVGERMATLKQGSNRYEIRAQKVEVSAETSRKQTVHATLKEVADQLKVGRSSIEKVRYAKDKGIPELVASIEAGKLAVEAARQIAHLPRAEQSTALEKAAKEKREKKHEPTVSVQEVAQTEPDPVALAWTAIKERALDRINRSSIYPLDLPLPVVPDSTHKTEHIQEAIAELRPLEPLIATMGWRQLYDEVQLNVQRIQTYGDKFTRVGLGGYRIELPWQQWAEDVGQKVQARVSMILARKPRIERPKAERRPTRSGPERRLWDYRKKLGKLLRDADFLEQEADQVGHETMQILATYFEERRALYAKRKPHQNGVEPNGQTPSLK